MKILILLTALLTALPSQAHLLPADHGTFRFDEDKVYVVLAMDPAVLALYQANDRALSSQVFDQYYDAIASEVRRGVRVYSADSPAELLDLRIAPTLAHGGTRDKVDVITALAVFRVNESVDSVRLDMALFAPNPSRGRYQLTISDAASLEKHQYIVTRQDPVVELLRPPRTGAGAQ